MFIVHGVCSKQGLFDIAAQRYKDYQERARLSELQELLASANVATRPSFSEWQPMQLDSQSADGMLGVDIPTRRMPLVQPSRAVAARAVGRSTSSKAERAAAVLVDQQADAAVGQDDPKPQMMPNMRNEIDAW